MVPRNSAIASDLPILLLDTAGANLQGKMDRDGHLAAKLLTKSREFESAPGSRPRLLAILLDGQLKVGHGLILQQLPYGCIP